ncbi:AcrR family transcriptional regulator [Thermocatellispora tengchongensis]|uniref:AcrR family transcriptional regulator n=1 Tax=Thermocatellispora tengchongensis TaxID=1073253 RepID=A0A840P4B5_9ACTN|nr:TetR/AcrR family transcriptional regulator [Thermocatellispora tengchongensis]MBB5132077.1 AcrR family transcriptional regulator [Thermocatellispora tengchongensis]
MAEELGLRERKKRETRRRIADVAMGLFAAKGFDNVTVAEVARAADVSVNTVFNYFGTKEDLFLDRSDEAVASLGEVVRARRPGESALDALRRDFFEALETRDWRHGFNDGADVFARLVGESHCLQTRLLSMHEQRERALAATLAEETGADPDDLMPSFAAAQICAVLRLLTTHFTRRRLAGETHEQIAPGIREQAEIAFRTLECGIGPYARRPREQG